MRCERLAAQLPGLVDGGVSLDEHRRAHLAHCLRCQADVARYRRLRRELGAIATHTIDPPEELFGALASGLADGSGSLTSRDHRRRAAYIGGLAATAAGVGGALVLAARSRRLVG